MKRPNLQPYQWGHNGPPRFLYMREWYNSLDDTPGLFTASQIQKTQVPKQLKRYLKERPTKGNFVTEKIELLGWSFETLFGLLPPESVLFVSVFDFSEFLEPCGITGRAYPGFEMVFKYKNEDDEESSFDFHTSAEREEYELNPDRCEPSLRSRYLDGNPQDHVSFSTLGKVIRDRLKGPSYREEIIKSHQKQLLDRLKDSVSKPSIKLSRLGTDKRPIIQSGVHSARPPRRIGRIIDEARP